jgi:hypothetical protein
MIRIVLATAIALAATNAHAEMDRGLRAGPRAKLETVCREWLGIRARHGVIPSQPTVRVRPKLGDPELRQLARIARMPIVSLVSDSVIGANAAYYESLRIGEPLPGSRMVSLEMPRGGMVSSTTRRGGVTIVRRPWGDGRVVKEIQFQAPRDRDVTSRGLRRAGVFPGAHVSIRKLPGSPSAITIAPPGRIQPIAWDPDGYTLMPTR